MKSHNNRALFYKLTEQYHEIFCFRFFHESSSPKQLKITLGSFKFFFLNFATSTGGNFATHVNNIGGKYWEQYQTADS